MKSKNQKMRKLINEEFVVLTYREKYNLPLNDKTYMDLSEIEMDFDLRLSKNYKRMVKEILDSDDYDEDDSDYDEIESIDEINSKGDGSKVKLRAGFTQKDIDEFWEKDLNG